MPLIGLVFYTLLGWALWNYLTGVDWSRFRSAPLFFEWLIAAAIVTTIGKLPFALVWQRLLLGMGVRPDLRELLRVYSLSWLGRYTPGKAVMVGARLLYARKLGASEAQAMISFMIEQILQLSVATGLAIGLIVWAGHNPLPNWLSALLLACVAAGWVATSPSVLRHLLRWGFALFRQLQLWMNALRNRSRSQASLANETNDGQDSARLSENVFPHARSLREATLLHVLLQIAYGGYTMLIAAGVLGIDALEPTLLAHLWGTYMLSVCIGMLAIFAPAGLGAREAVQLVLLQTVLSPEQAGLLIVLHRLIEVATDCLLFGLVQIATRLHV